MKRLFFLVPDLKSTKSISKEMEQVGVLDSQIHVVGAHPQELDKAHIHQASLLQTSDLVPAIKRGALLGVFIGFAILGLFSLVLPASVVIPNYAIGIIFVFGILFGIWVSGMIGVGIKNPTVEKYEKYVNSGHYVMMVDVPKEREHELVSRVVRHHPGTHLAKEA